MRSHGPKFSHAVHLLAVVSLVGCNLFSEQHASFDDPVSTHDVGRDSPRTPDAQALLDVTTSDLAHSDVVDAPDLASDDVAVVHDLSDLGTDAAPDVDADTDPEGCAAALALSPIIYWPLDGLDEQLQYPNIGTAEAGSLTPLGVPMPVPGVHGQGVALDGVDDALLFDHSVVWKLSDGSISLWFQAAGLPNSPTEWAAMLSKDALGYGEGGHIIIFADGAGAVTVRLQDTTASYDAKSANDVVKIGDWHHVVATFGAQGMRLYIDGALLGTDSYQDGLYNGDGSIYNTEPGAIGAGTDLSNVGQHTPISRWLKGSIDEVLVFNRALTAVEVADLYSGCGP